MSARDADATIHAFQRNVVVAASAGTGKTHRLTALYVLLCLGLTSMGEATPGRAADPLPPARIWATTFTRAAAAEIAERVVRALRALAVRGAEGDDVPFLSEIQARLDLVGPVPQAALRRRAEQALGLWSAARIDTLHGLARHVVERHGVALGLPPALSILDEDEAAHISARAVDRVLTEALGGGGDAAEAARDLLVACGNVGAVRSQVARLLDRLDEEGLPAGALRRVDHLVPALAARERLGRVAEAAAAEGSAPFRGPASALAALLRAAPAGPALLPEKTTDSILELLTGRAPRKKTPADEELLAFRDDLGNDTLRLRAERFIAWLRNAHALNAREVRIARLLDAIAAASRADRARQAALGFGDLLRLARDGLRDRPHVAAAVRADVGALLVDEFQDTSRVQRDLVYLLREPLDRIAARAPGQMPEAAQIEAHGLLVVGDRKQSIYGFRGADVAVFAEVCGALGGAPAAEALCLGGGPWPAAGAANADFVALRESRRSGAAVLAFVNAFSARDFSEGRAEGAAPAAFEVTYSAAEQLVAARPPEERGEVVAIDDDGAVPDGADALTREAEGPLREALVAAAWISSEMRRTGRRPGDFAVLARRRNTLPLVETALGRIDVPYVVAGRALFEASEVRDVAALVRLALDPRDRHALATVLRGPVVALSDTALAALCEPGRGLAMPMTGVLPAAQGALAPDEMRRLQSFRTRFGVLRTAVLRAPPASALSALVTGFDLDRVIAALPRPDARLANVDRLIAIAAERGGSLASFSRWLDRRIDDESDEPEGVVFDEADDAVRLLTIHGSKGLDFPVVVVVDLAAEPRPQYPGVDLGSPGSEGGGALVVRHFGPTPGPTEAGVPAPIALNPPALREAQALSRAREQAERRRITYVALTRARDALVLVSPPPRPLRGSSAWRTFASELSAEDLATVTRRERAADLLAEAQERLTDAVTREANRAAARAAAAALPPPIAEIDPGSVRTVSLSTTALAMFDACPRRYRLRHLLGFEEPLASSQLNLFAPIAGDDDGRDEVKDSSLAAGRAAHRVLERWPLDGWGAATHAADVLARLADEGLDAAARGAAKLAASVAAWLSGPYAAALRDEGLQIAREHTFAIRAGEGPALLLRGAVDLVAHRADGSIDVVDYKRSAAHDPAPHAFQLRAYGLALATAHPGSRVRAGIAFLGARWGSGSPPASAAPYPDENRPSGDGPAWIGREAGGYFSEEEHEHFRARLADLARAYARARIVDRWDGVAVPRCRQLRCGFIAACHGGLG